MNITEKLSGWAKRLVGARAAVSELHAVDKEFREQHLAAVKHRDFVRNAPPPLPEILQAMEIVVDAAAARWTQEHARTFLTELGPHMKAERDGRDTLPQPTLPELLAFRELRGEALVGLFPELLKARLREILSDMEYAAGPAQTDRARLLAEAEATIRQIEDQHAELVDQAAALDPPVLLRLLPAVADRRESERIRVNRETQAAERRRELEAAVNRAAPPLPTAIPSPYLIRERGSRALRNE